VYGQHHYGSCCSFKANVLYLCDACHFFHNFAVEHPAFHVYILYLVPSTCMRSWCWTVGISSYIDIPLLSHHPSPDIIFISIYQEACCHKCIFLLFLSQPHHCPLSYQKHVSNASLSRCRMGSDNLYRHPGSMWIGLSRLGLRTFQSAKLLPTSFATKQKWLSKH